MIKVEIDNNKGKLITTMDFCRIPSGSFMMGEKDERRRVTIENEYYLGKYPVTQAQWQAVMGENPSRFTGDLNRPVEKVSWNDCQTFIAKLNEAVGEKRYRLPTEAEWEYACRAGTETEYYFGDEESELRHYAWYLENSEYTSYPVGQLRPNAWGLYDMLGNVWEWCEDLYDKDSSDRVVRSGAFFGYPKGARCAFRYKGLPYDRHYHLGFRVVLRLSL